MKSTHLDAKQLEAFSSVMSVGSITGAAKVLGRSQSLVTRLVQDLEDELGFALLHRNGPRITPTEQGVKFYAEAELILAGLRNISDRARAIADEPVGSLNISAIAALAAGLVPQAIRQLSPALRPSKLHLQSTTPESVIQSIIARVSDLGIASLPIDHPGLDLHWVGEVPCVAVLAVDHPLADRAVLTPQDLRDMPLILPANPYRQRLRINEALGAHGVEPNVVIDSNATFVSLATVRASLGIAIVESATVVGLPVEGVRIVPLSFHIPFVWGVVTASSVPLSPTVEALIDALRDAAETSFPGFKLTDRSA